METRCRELITAFRQAKSVTSRIKYGCGMEKIAVYIILRRNSRRNMRTPTRKNKGFAQSGAETE